MSEGFRGGYDYSAPVLGEAPLIEGAPRPAGDLALPPGWLEASALIAPGWLPPAHAENTLPAGPSAYETIAAHEPADSHPRPVRAPHTTPALRPAVTLGALSHGLDSSISQPRVSIPSGAFEVPRLPARQRARQVADEIGHNVADSLNQAKKATVTSEAFRSLRQKCVPATGRIRQTVRNQNRRERGAAATAIPAATPLGHIRAAERERLPRYAAVAGRALWEGTRLLPDAVRVAHTMNRAVRAEAANLLRRATYRAVYETTPLGVVMNALANLERPVGSRAIKLASRTRKGLEIATLYLVAEGGRATRYIAAKVSATPAGKWATDKVDSLLPVVWHAQQAAVDILDDSVHSLHVGAQRWGYRLEHARETMAALRQARVMFRGPDLLWFPPGAQLPEPPQRYPRQLRLQPLLEGAFAISPRALRRQYGVARYQRDAETARQLAIAYADTHSEEYAAITRALSVGGRGRTPDPHPHDLLESVFTLALLQRSPYPGVGLISGNMANGGRIPGVWYQLTKWASTEAPTQPLAAINLVQAAPPDTEAHMPTTSTVAQPRSAGPVSPQIGGTDTSGPPAASSPAHPPARAAPTTIELPAIESVDAGTSGAPGNPEQVGLYVQQLLDTLLVGGSPERAQDADRLLAARMVFQAQQAIGAEWSHVAWGLSSMLHVDHHNLSQALENALVQLTATHRAEQHSVNPNNLAIALRQILDAHGRYSREYDDIISPTRVPRRSSLIPGPFTRIVMPPLHDRPAARASGALPAMNTSVPSSPVAGQPVGAVQLADWQRILDALPVTRATSPSSDQPTSRGEVSPPAIPEATEYPPATDAHHPFPAQPSTPLAVDLAAFGETSSAHQATQPPQAYIAMPYALPAPKMHVYNGLDGLDVTRGGSAPAVVMLPGGKSESHPLRGVGAPPRARRASARNPMLARTPPDFDGVARQHMSATVADVLGRGTEGLKEQLEHAPRSYWEWAHDPQRLADLKAMVWETAPDLYSEVCVSATGERIGLGAIITAALLYSGGAKSMDSVVETVVQALTDWQPSPVATRGARAPRPRNADWMNDGKRPSGRTADPWLLSSSPRQAPSHSSHHPPRRPIVRDDDMPATNRPAMASLGRQALGVQQRGNGPFIPRSQWINDDPLARLARRRDNARFAA